jgi:RHS repeat-associated protein
MNKKHLSRFYRNIIVIISITLFPMTIFCQNKPISESTPPNISFSDPNLTIMSEPEGNFEQVWQAKVPIVDETSLNTLNNSSVNLTTKYVDGFGNVNEIIERQASPQNTDIVTPFLYDQFGRLQYKYMSFTNNKTGGGFEEELYQLNTFLSQQYPGEKVFYNKVDLENSPLNRVQKTYAPGNSWAGSGVGTSIQHLINTTNDAVQIWQIGNDAISDNNGSDPVIDDNIPYSTQTYTAGTLYKNVTIDENGNATVVYTDLDGNAVLKKVQVGTGIPTDFSGQDNKWLCTYYVYDDYNNLRFTISPQAVVWLQQNNWSFATSGGDQVVSELCFRYEYDGLNRIVAQKAPGVGWAYMVYDLRNRPVFSQSDNMRSGSGTANQEWAYAQYDVLDRPIQTGMLQGYSGTRQQLQDYVNGLTNTSSASSITVNSSSSVPKILVITKADPGRMQYQASQEIDLNGITLSPGVTISIVPPQTSSATINQSINSNPAPSTGNEISLHIINYDDYSWTTNKPYNYTDYYEKLDKGTNNYADPFPQQASILTLGKVTGDHVRIIENQSNLADPLNNSWLENLSYYDDKGRTIQTQNTNYKGGMDIATLLYNFVGQVVCSYSVNNNLAGNVNGMAVKTNWNYDNNGRLLAVYKELNDDPSTFRSIEQNTYNAVGQLANRQLGEQTYDGYPVGETTDISYPTSNTSLENQDFTYNIRGWLKGINWDYSNSGYTKSNVNVAANKWFSIDLSYDWGFTNNQVNGNIAGQRWESAGDMSERAYGYTYDNASRLLAADFNQNFGSGTNSYWSQNDPNGKLNIDYDVKMGDGVNYSTAYDQNGNIQQLQQWGLQLNSSIPIDNLSYSYNTNSNKLSSVNDQIPGNNKLGDFTNNTSGNSYGYDVNGNMVTNQNNNLNGNITVDQNPGAGAIQYNYLNEPSVITVSNTDGSIKGTITYIYDAEGKKLEKRVVENPTTANPSGISTTTTYIGGFEYKNNTLEFFAHEEGRIRRVYETSNGAYSYYYDYFIKDNLGNIRMVLTDEQKTDIYPAATLEGDPGSSNSAISTESKFYSINMGTAASPGQGTIVDNPVSIPSDETYENNNGIADPNPNNTTTATNTSLKMYDLNANSGQAATGLGITLKVMAGDHINIYGKSYFLQNDPNPSNDNTVAPLALLSSLLNTPAGSMVASGEGLNASQILTENNNGQEGLPSFLNSNYSNSTTPAPPNASINYIVFDEHFQYVSSGASLVKQSGIVEDHHEDLQNISIPKNGYIYIYCSNASPVDVYFDNLQVTHTHGPLVQDNTYSPWGLQLQSISSHAVYFGNAETQRYLYNGKELQSHEFSDGTGLDEYDYGARLQDPQLGVWHNADPAADKYAGESPYAYVFNNPISLTDPTGMDPSDGYSSSNGNYIPAEDPGGIGNPGNVGVPGFDYNVPTTPASSQNVINQLWNNGGGTWTPENGYSYFNGEQGEVNWENENGLVNSNKYSYENETGTGIYYDFTYEGDVHYEAGGHTPEDTYHYISMAYDPNVSDFTDASGGQEESSGWETAGKVNEALAFSYETTEQAAIGFQRLGNWASGSNAKIFGAGEAVELGGKVLAGVGAAFTIADGMQNGFKAHHAADLTLDVTIYAISAEIPVAGWVVGGAFFIGNLISEHYTGKSITENAFDDDN